MLLNEALEKVINNLKNKNFELSKHFKQRMDERFIEKEELVNIFSYNELVSFQKQNKNLYKLLYYYNSKKDLAIIVNTQKEIKLVTVYTVDNSKRIRQNEK
ncbi:MAG: DUF4258 domain-containing protein [Candidatus Woesearchaeota archaeon]